MNLYDNTTIEFAKLLNTAQLEAVTMLHAPLCILAGAGTGKTRVITHRIAYLIQQGVKPENILGVTFTNKAANEMRNRVNMLLPGGISHRVHLGTFHGLSAKLLRRYGESVGVPNSFLIYDTADSEKCLRQLAHDHFNIGKDDLGFYQKQIERWQNEGILPPQVQTTTDFRLMRVKELYALYMNALSHMGVLDFNSLLLKWRDLLINPESSVKLFSQFKHILVDEYQDTNAIQADIVERLGAKAETIAIVGDDDQSIYSWRGAKPANMQKFLDDLPHAKLVKLERNYRSTSNILDAANAVIENNTSRLGKNLFAVGAAGVPIRMLRGFSDRQEAEMIINIIHNDLLKGHSLNDFAILMRTNSQSRLLEEALRRVRMPYRLLGGIKFYDRKEVKDILATLRVALNPRSDIDFLRAVGAVPRGIGDTSIKKAQIIARNHEKSLMEVFLSVDLLNSASISPRTIKKMQNFAKQLHELGLNSVDHAEEAVAQAIVVSGVAERLQEEQSDEANDKLENIGQLLSAAGQHVADASLVGGDISALGYLETASLMSSVDDLVAKEGADGAVTLMTLHAAKGLEFDCVFIIALEEYGFPHARALNVDAGEHELEEERRLAYVGMTRARKQLYLTYAQKRMIHGVVKGRVPSRFLRELPREIVEGDYPVWQYGDSESIKVELDPDFAEPIVNPDGLTKGSRVAHVTFGSGRVLEVRGSGQFARASVLFDGDSRERAIITRFLRKI